MEMNFCRRCGSPLKQQNGHTFYCTGATNHKIYANTTPAVGIFLMDGEQNVSLSVRGIEPRKGMLDAFGGFLDGQEFVEDALKRELQEELGISRRDYEQPMFLCSGIGNYPFQNEIVPVTSLFFFARLKPHAKLIPQDDVAAIQTFALDDVPLERLHDADIVHGIKSLQALFAS